MKFLKNIPNYISLGNLFLGICACIVALDNPGQEVLQKINGEVDVLPVMGDLNRLIMASFLILMAAILDFFDGFVARLLNAQSEMGKHLDSLSDIVSFGIAPSFILYELLHFSYASRAISLKSPSWELYTAFFFALCAAWRLAKFSAEGSSLPYFKGLPTPAASMFVIGIPMLAAYSSEIHQLIFNNTYILFIIIFGLGFLMNASFPFIAFKSMNLNLKEHKLKLVLIILALGILVYLQFAGLSLVILIYIISSILFYKPETQKHEIQS